MKTAMLTLMLMVLLLKMPTIAVMVANATIIVTSTTLIIEIGLMLMLYAVSADDTAFAVIGLAKWFPSVSVAQKNVVSTTVIVVTVVAVVEHRNSDLEVFVAEFDEQDANLESYPYDLGCRDQYAVIRNPLFQNYTRRLLQGVLRICGKTALFVQSRDCLVAQSTVASFCNIEEELPTEEDLLEKERQELLRDSEQTKALSIVAKKLPDAKLSFLESLLSIPHLLFNSLTLLVGHLEALGTDASHAVIFFVQGHYYLFCSCGASLLNFLNWEIGDLRRSMLPYDYLVVATGLQDDSLHALKIQSMGAGPLGVRGLRVEHVTDGYRRVNGAMSAAVYGRSLNAYCVVQGLLLRQAQATAQQGLSVDAFYEGDEVEKKIHHILETMGLKVYEGYRLLGIQQCTRDRLEVAPRPAEELAAAEREREKRFPAPEAARAPMGIMEDFGASPAGLPQKVHGNGLVYDGKGPGSRGASAGSLCEFSRRFQRRYLRHDGFNGREVGGKLATALLKKLDPVNGDSVAAGGPSVNTGSTASPRGRVAPAMSSDSDTELMPTLADAYRLALDHLQMQGLEDPPPVETPSAQLLVLLDLNGVLVRRPSLAKRLQVPHQQVVEIKIPPGDNGISFWAYTRPDEVRRLVDFLTEQPIHWGIYSTMTRWNALNVLRRVFQEADRPIREESSRSYALPRQSLEYGHRGNKWFWFFTQEDHHEYDPNSPPFPGHEGLSAYTPGVNSGHGQSLLTAGVVSDVQEYLDARRFESRVRVCPILVAAAPKKTKLIRGLNLLIEDYDDQAVETGNKTGLKRVETAVRTALRDLNAVGSLLVEANTAFLFRKGLRGLTVPEHIKDKIFDFLDPLPSAGDD
ncbi:hypothetical protein AK812_SmicGene7407 [Symbiodinium microadriaticum]|uniref:FCP1 homology domain-containing protein n=1 Tax=Symbiodinium microadriaticum TaxID=2951 RepID=A0A1Q9ENS3_SYMMI|nr:hypothetical protein AK812_SmicGene7407 [Symbiodinium microadriaticum]